MSVWKTPQLLAKTMTASSAIAGTMKVPPGAPIAITVIGGDEQQSVFYGKVGGVIVTGNEDGIKHVAMNVLYSLGHVGYTIPPQADAGWIGEAGPGPDRPRVRGAVDWFDTPRRYGRVSRGFHWLMAALIVLALGLGSALAFTAAGKDITARSRPPRALAVPPYESSPSFPSGHTVTATVTAVLVAYLVFLTARSRRVRAAAGLPSRRPAPVADQGIRVTRRVSLRARRGRVIPRGGSVIAQ